MLDFSVFLESKPIVYSLSFLAVVAAGLWVLSIYWVYQDIFKRTKNTPLQISSIVIAVLFPYFGLLMYILLRPNQTLDERRMNLLDEKIMRRQLGGLNLCPNCHKSVEADYLFCPYCKMKIKESCPRCDKSVDKQFDLCPYCGYEIKETKKGKAHKDEPKAKPKT